MLELGQRIYVKFETKLSLIHISSILSARQGEVSTRFVRITTVKFMTRTYRPLHNADSFQIMFIYNFPSEYTLRRDVLLLCTDTSTWIQWVQYIVFSQLTTFCSFMLITISVLKTLANILLFYFDKHLFNFLFGFSKNRKSLPETIYD